MPFIGGGRSHTNKARERRKQQIPIPKSVTTGWNEKQEFVGPTYFFTDGNSEKIRYIDQCCNTAPQFFMAYGEIRLSFLWLTADSPNFAK